MQILNRNKAGFKGHEAIVDAAISWHNQNPDGESGNLGVIEVTVDSSPKRSGPGFSNDSGPSL